MADKKQIVLDSRGQAVIEYVLLLVVLTSLFATIINSDIFQENLGQDAAFFKKLAARMEYTYRYGNAGDNDNFQGYDGTGHGLYYEDSGQSRFFSPTEKID